ncbi:MAG: hypothetical protein ACTSUV_05245 [Candidatus Ranarchaeia archaeon]
MNNILSGLMMLLQNEDMFPGFSGFTIDVLFLIVNGLTAVLGLIIIVNSIKTAKEIVQLFPQGNMAKNWKNVRILLVVFQIIYFVLLTPWALEYLFAYDIQGLIEPWLLPVLYLAGLAAVMIATSVSLKTYQLIKNAQGE